MLKNPVIRNVLSAVAVAGAGFVLLNLVFIFFASIAWVLEKLIIPGSTPMERPWFMPVSFAISAAIIALISWFVFRSKLATLGKAIFMTVPVAVGLALIGIQLYRWPVAALSLGGLLSLGVLYYFYRTKQPWLYHYVVILVALTLAMVTILGVEI
ncbi:MAG: hypothetical protein AAB402_02840 [Patescibacteria group bacterium]